VCLLEFELSPTNERTGYSRAAVTLFSFQRPACPPASRGVEEPLQ
jgi:hypothetical protein